MINTHITHVNRFSLQKKYFRNFILGMSLVLMSVGPYLNEAFAIPLEPHIVDHVTIQRSGAGLVNTYTLPIYQVGDIRFLSAGVGIEERQASYPSFPLKLIFAQAGGAFIAGVSVTIQDLSGKEVLKISEAQISGPWLFLNLVPGTYRVTAIRRDGTVVNQTVRLQEGKKKVTHLHWPTKN